MEDEILFPTIQDLESDDCQAAEPPRAEADGTQGQAAATVPIGDPKKKPK